MRKLYYGRKDKFGSAEERSAEGLLTSELFSVVYLTHLYNNAAASFPCKRESRTKETGFRIKSGMTKSKGITDTVHWLPSLNQSP
jgi:hypothetical protein